MIIDMPNTRTREIAHKIEQLHEERGESATGRVLTLLIAPIPSPGPPMASRTRPPR